MAFYVDPEEMTGSVANLLLAIDDHAATFTAGGLNTPAIKTRLEGIASSHAGKKRDRDNDKIKAAGSQSAYEGSARNNYQGVSDIVDLMSGAAGKHTPLGQHILNRRKNLTGANKHHAGSSSSNPPSSSSCSCSCSCSCSSSSSCSCSCSSSS